MEYYGDIVESHRTSFDKENVNINHSFLNILVRFLNSNEHELDEFEFDLSKVSKTCSILVIIIYQGFPNFFHPTNRLDFTKFNFYICAWKFYIFQIRGAFKIVSKNLVFMHTATY